MLSFCGMDLCAMDANGRIKLSPRVIRDFAAAGGDPVLHCLPEGAVAVYPEETYRQMRSAERAAVEKAGESFVYRRTSRRFGAWSMSTEISPQGRITLPPAYRQHAELKAGEEVYVVGVENGVEIWNKGRWEEEQRIFMEHVRKKGEQEMASDLLPAAGKESEE